MHGMRDIPDYQGKSVYVFLFDNNEVKIGVSCQVKKRIMDLERQTKRKVIKWYASAPFVNSYEIENKMHIAFNDYLVKGQYEYFNIPYDETVYFVKKYTDENGKMERVDYEKYDNDAKKVVCYFHPELNGIL